MNVLGPFAGRLIGMEEKYLSPKDAAEILTVKKTTVYDMIKQGRLKAVKIGKQFRIREADVLALVGGAPEEGAEGAIPAAGRPAGDRSLRPGHAAGQPLRPGQRGEGISGGGPVLPRQLQRHFFPLPGSSQSGPRPICGTGKRTATICPLWRRCSPEWRPRSTISSTVPSAFTRRRAIRRGSAPSTISPGTMCA